MRVAVTGGRGYLGQFVVDRFLREGTEVVATLTSLDEPTKSNVRKGLHWFEWRLSDPSCSFEFLYGADTLVHTAFQHVPGRYRGGEGDDPKNFLQKNLIGTLDLLQQARKCGVRRTVFVSSRAIFGRSEENSRTVPIRDEEPPFPDTLYGLYKTVVEHMCQEYSDIGMCSIRPTGIYGIVDPIEKSKWFNLCKAVDLRKTKPSVDQAKTEVHGEDVAEALFLMVTAPDNLVVQQAFNCSDVAVSESQLRYIATALQDGSEDCISTEQLPRSLEPHNQMACPRLSNLGWRPGGWPKLISTMRELMASANGSITSSQNNESGI